MSTSVFTVAPSAIQTPILPLKVTLPTAGGAPLRPELRALLSDARLYPVTMVVAPAGYGKTTLMVQWANELQLTGASICWLTLDSSDRDPAALPAYLIESFRRMSQVAGMQNVIGEGASRILHSAPDPSQDWPLVVGALCSDLQAQLRAQTFLFIDDIHTVTDSPLAVQVLNFVLRAAPPMLHIVLASRRAPDLAPLTRMRADGDLLEIDQRDLRLTEEQTQVVLANQGVDLPADELAQLLDRTEGWALSVQLLARMLARYGPEQRSDVIHSLSEGRPDLFAYLASDVMADLPPDVVAFLHLAAMPTYFDMALLREVAGPDVKQDLFELAQNVGLAMLPIDESGVTLRLHPLWRALLLRDGRAQLGADKWAQYQQAFGRALEHRGDLEQALAHYAEAGATDDLARALRFYAWPLLDSPRRTSIRQWLALLPAAQRNAEPELLHMWAWSQIGVNPSEAAVALKRAADGYRTNGQYDRELRAISDLAALLFWQDRAEEFEAACVRAIKSANVAQDDWARGSALAAVVALLYSRGRAQAALRVARRAAQHPCNAFWQWLLALIVASINVELGRPTQAIAAINTALSLPQIDRDDRLRQNLLRLRAVALYQQGQLSEALALAFEAHQRLSDYYQDGAAGLSALGLALLLAENGRREEAQTYLVHARSTANAIGSTSLLMRAQILEIHFMRLQGNSAATEAAAQMLRSIDVQNDGNDLWYRLLLVITLGEGQHPQAAEQLRKLVALMGDRGYSLFLVAAQLYRAALAGRQGNTEERDEALRLGWTLLEPGEDRVVPVLPLAVLADSVVGALQLGLATPVVADVLRRQLPDQAAGLLMGLLGERDPAVRIRAARLLGDLGVAAAYPALRPLLKDRIPEVRQAAETALDRLVYRPQYQLRIRTLGAFGVWLSDVEVRDRDWRSIKARQLLQLLLIERGRLMPRDRIFDALWPELESDAAANNLRVTFSRLYKALEPERPEGAPSYYIQQHGDSYGFNDASNYQLDAADFTNAVMAGQRADQRKQTSEAVAFFQQAIALYRGPFLPDSLYEDWSVIERERLGLLFNLAALRLGELLLEDGQAHETIGLAWRVLERDEAQEEAYTLLMRAHAQLGDRSSALRIYQRCVRMLAQELGVEPLPETVALYEMLRKSGSEATPVK